MNSLKDAKIIRGWKNTADYHPGVDVETTEVYSLYPGAVIDVSEDSEGYYIVTIQTNENEAMRYGHLDTVDIDVAKGGSPVTSNQYIGKADRYCHVEYITCWRGSSNFEVRAGNFKYYKQDPSNILRGTYNIEEPVDVKPVSIQTVFYTFKDDPEFK